MPKASGNNASRAKRPNRATQPDVQSVIDMFNEGNLLARAHYSEFSTNRDVSQTSDPSELFKINTQSFLDEAAYIAHQDPDEMRSGNRATSTTLLVPGLSMHLFNDIAFLHDADQCTVRGYLLDDGATIARRQSFGNINVDKKKFENVLNRQAFIERYRKHFTENPAAGEYNEVIANLFPDSIVGLTINQHPLSTDVKFRALCVQNDLKKERGIDLPIFIYQSGKLVEFKPTEEELLEIANHIPYKINQFLQDSRFNKLYTGSEEDLIDSINPSCNTLLAQMGYELSNPNEIPWQATPGNLWKKGLDEHKLDKIQDLIQETVDHYEAKSASLKARGTSKSRVASIDDSIAKLKQLQTQLQSEGVGNQDIVQSYQDLTEIVASTKKSKLNLLKLSETLKNIRKQAQAFKLADITTTAPGFELQQSTEGLLSPDKSSSQSHLEPLTAADGQDVTQATDLATKYEAIAESLRQARDTINFENHGPVLFYLNNLISEIESVNNTQGLNDRHVNEVCGIYNAAANLIIQEMKKDEPNIAVAIVNANLLLNEVLTGYDETFAQSKHNAKIMINEIDKHLLEISPSFAAQVCMELKQEAMDLIAECSAKLLELQTPRNVSRAKLSFESPSSNRELQRQQNIEIVQTLMRDVKQLSNQLDTGITDAHVQAFRSNLDRLHEKQKSVNSADKLKQRTNPIAKLFDKASQMIENVKAKRHTIKRE